MDHGFVGVEADALAGLAVTVRAASGAAAQKGRELAVLLDEAGEPDVTCGAMPALAEQLGAAADDLRRRAEIGEDWVAASAPWCALPWHYALWETLKGAPQNHSDGMWDSLVEIGENIDALMPGQPGAGQRWRDLGRGAALFVQNPVEGFLLAGGRRDWEERGVAYWAGTWTPTLLMMAAGGVGLVPRVVKIASTMADVGAAADNLADEARRRRAAPTGPPARGDATHPRRRTRRRRRSEGEGASQRSAAAATSTARSRSASRTSSGPITVNGTPNATR